MRRVSKFLACLAGLVAAALIAALITNSLKLWVLLTDLGSEQAYVILSIAITILLDADAGISSLYAVLASACVVIWLKEFLGLPRPPKSLWRVKAEGPGFPSGHTQVSTSFWTLLSTRFRLPALTALSVVTIVSVGASRLALMVHYPRDVLGGAAIGLCLGIIVWAITLGPGRRLTIGSGFHRAPAAYYLLPFIIGAASIAEGAIYSFDTAFKVGGLALSLIIYPPLAWRIRVVNRAPWSVRIQVFIATLAVALALTGASSYLAREAGIWVYAPMYLITGLAIVSVAAASPSAILKRLEAGRGGRVKHG